jgi:hypothetical protein
MLCLSPAVRVKNPKSEILFDFCRFRAWWHLAALEFAQYPDSLPLFLPTLLCDTRASSRYCSRPRLNRARNIGRAVPLLLFELFQFVRCVLIFGIELEAFAIVGNGLLFLTVLRIGLGQAVMDVA